MKARDKHDWQLRVAITSLSIIVSFTKPLAAQMTTSTWLNTGGGNWTDATSWSNSVVPNDSAFFSVGSGYSVTQNANVTLGTLRLWVPSGSYAVPAGQWLFVTNAGGVAGNVNNGLSLTHPSTMTLLIHGGQVTNSGFHLGGGAQIVITNGGVLYTRNMGQTRIERNGALTLYDGIWDHVPHLEVAFDGTIGGAVANVNLVGGSALFRGNLVIGARETGIVTINGASVTNWGDLIVGARAPTFYGSATGQLNLASGLLLHMRSLLVGDTDYDSTNRSLFMLTGGEYRNTTNANGAMVIGNRSTGALHIAAGSFVATNGIVLRIGTNGHPRGVGYVTNSGGIMRLGSADVRNGRWVIEGGTVLVDSTLLVTNTAGSLQFTSGLLAVGSMNISNGSVLTIGGGAMPAILGLGGNATFVDGLVLSSANSAIVVSNSGATAHRLIGNLSGSGSLLKLGSGWAILDGINTYSGGTTSQVGILEAVNAMALPGYNIPGGVRVSAGATVAVMAGGTGQWTPTEVDSLLANVSAAAGSFLGFDIPSNAFTYGSTIAGTYGLVKLGPGTLTLSGVNTYSGPTFVRNGILRLDASDSLPTAGNLVLGSTNVLATGGTFDLNGHNQRVGRLFGVTVTNSNATATNHVINLAPGRELAVVSSSADRFVQVQMGAHLALSGGGRLALTNTAGTVLLWGLNSADLVNFRGLDASGLSEIHADVSSIVVGFDPSSGETQSSRQAVLILASTNTIRAATLTLGQSPRDGAVRGRLLLGATNRLNVSALRIGYDKSSGWLLFRDDVMTPSVWISGRNPGERVNISQGAFLSLNSGTQPHGYFLATNEGSSVNIYADSWMLGTLGTNASGAVAGGRGTTVIREGNLDVNMLLIGRSLPTVTVGSGLGWFTLLGGTMLINSNIVLAQRLGGGDNIAGTLTLSGGVTTVFGNIMDGGGTSTLILDGGTLDMQNNSIGSLANPIDTLTLASGVLRNVGQINGGGGWAKTGSGTLIMQGTHGYTGALNVESGTLQYNATYTGGGLITVQNTAMLSGTGSVAGIYVASGGTLSPGVSPGALRASGNVTFEPGSIFAVEILGTLSGQYDQLLMSASAMLTLGDATLSVTAPDPLPYGHVFPIISGWGTLAPSTFAALPDGTTFIADANTFQINYGTLSGYNDDVTLMVIPEPTTLGLLSAVSIVLFLRRRLLKMVWTSPL